MKYGQCCRRSLVVLQRLAALSIWASLPVIIPAQTQPKLATRHMRSEVATAKAQFLRRTPATQVMRLDLMLPLRNQDQLDALLRDLYDRNSASYHQFLTVQQFTDQFGPSDSDYAKVIEFAGQNGLAVAGTSPNRMVVSVRGTVAAVEKAFNVVMGNYQHPTEQRTFYSPDREPSPNMSVKLWHVAGLDNFSIPRPVSLVRSLAIKDNATGSGPGGYFIGTDFRAAYYGNGPLDGAGQSIGLVEFAGYNVNDVTTYFAQVSQPFNPGVVVGVSTDGSSLDCSGKCDDTEQVLDIEAALSMAPGLDSVRVYVSGTSDVSIFNRMAYENIAKSLSCSWGWSPADPASDDPIFQEFAAQGQSLFVASGDSGAYKSRRGVYPADDAYITSVGGTDLVTAGPGGPWVAETAWVDSGGGISPNRIPIPYYQPVTISQTPEGSPYYRNSPDVSAEANTDNFICYNGVCAGGWGGTSFAAPRWAGLIALANQQSLLNGTTPVGFINPALYGIALGPNYGADYHDITVGGNGTYSAHAGYDLVTGWGSPNGPGMIYDLSNH